MEGTWQLSSRNKVIPGMGGPGMGGRRGFNFFLAFTVLFSFFMAVPAQAEECTVPMQMAVRNALIRRVMGVNSIGQAPGQP